MLPVLRERERERERERGTYQKIKERTRTVWLKWRNGNVGIHDWQVKKG
jgi:hypothetical protein